MFLVIVVGWLGINGVFNTILVMSCLYDYNLIYTFVLLVSFFVGTYAVGVT